MGADDQPNFELLEKLAELVPGAFQDGVLNWEALHMALGGMPEQSDQYGLSWVGKADAVKRVNTRSIGALHPAIDRSVEWDSAAHVFIEGENLEALRLLYRAYFCQVRLIYIGPPYNGGKDRIYHDDSESQLSEYLDWRADLSAPGPLSPPNPKTAPNYHSIWLTMLYPRIAIARHLLREDGFIVISVDDDELHHLRILMNEIFGEENHVATLVWERSRKNDAKLFSVGHEYMVVYAKSLETLRQRGVVLRAPKEGLDELRELWAQLRERHGDDFDAISAGLKKFYSTFAKDDPRLPLARFKKADEGGPYRDDADISWPGSGGPDYEVLHPTTGKPCKPPSRGWVYPNPQRMQDAIQAGLVVFGPDESTVPGLKSYAFQKSTQVLGSVHYSYSQNASKAFQSLFDGKRVYANPKHYQDIETLVDYLTDEADLVLDFFAGSGTTGHAVLESNRKNRSFRRYILVQLPEPVNPSEKSGKDAMSLGLKTVSEIALARLKRVIRNLWGEADDSTELARNGVRVFELAQSAFLQSSSADFGEEDSDLFLDRLRPEANELDALWEIILQEGLPLSASVSAEEVEGIRVYKVRGDGERALKVCLENRLSMKFVEALAIGSDEPFVCREVALDDEVSANLGKRCRLKTV